MPPRTRRGVGAASTGPPTPAPTAEPASSAETQPPPPPPPPTQQPAAQMGPPPVPASSGPAPTSSRSFTLKPKVVRRADEERKALAEQEEKKFNDRAAEDARRRRAASRGRGRGRGRGGRGRGRGDFGGFGRDGLVRRVEAPDGPLSQGAVLLSRGGRAGSMPGRYGGGGGYASGSGSGGGSSGIRAGAGSGSGPIFSMASETPEHDPRLNTDMFNSSNRGAGYGSDDDGTVKPEYEYVASSGSSGTGSVAPGVAGGAGGAKAKALRQQQGLLPMGIQRSEHREPEVQVATTAELEAADAVAAALAAGPVAAAPAEDDDDDDSGDEEFSDDDDDAGFVIDAANQPIEDDNEVWSRAIRTSGGVRLVDIDGQEIEVKDIDTLAQKRQEIAAKKAAAAAAAAAEADTVVKQEDEDENGAAVGVPTRTKKKRRQPRAAAAATAAARDQKNKDPEEVAIEEGLQVLLHDLALDAPTLETPDGPQPLPAAEAGAAAGTGDASRREGRLFLFQFPPVLPSLQSFKPDDSQTRGGYGPVKKEPGTDDNDDIVMLDSVRPATADQAIDLTAGTDTPEAGAAAAAAAEDGIGSGGFLGTLSVRRSGRTELSWGGMTFAMMPGADVQFLTSAVLLETADEKPPQPGTAAAARTTGHAFGMGPVGGKYNLVPVFSDETEWVVDPDELEGTGEVH